MEGKILKSQYKLKHRAKKKRKLDIDEVVVWAAGCGVVWCGVMWCGDCCAPYKFDYRPNRSKSRQCSWRSGKERITKQVIKFASSHSLLLLLEMNVCVCHRLKFLLANPSSSVVADLVLNLYHLQLD